MRRGEEFAAFTQVLEMRNEGSPQIRFRFVASETTTDAAGHIG
jgi:hypothetical protein